MYEKLVAAALASAAILVVGGAANAADVLGARPATPAAAAFPTISSEAEVFAGWGNHSWYDDFGTFGGAARATFWLAPNFSTQIDANFEHWEFGSSGGSPVGVGTLVGHANLRNQSYLLGAYGGAVYIDYGSKSGTNAWVAGGEGQLYLGNFTLEARAGWLGITQNSGFPGMQFRAAARYFIDPNTMLEINGGFQDLKYDVNTWNIGAVAEHKYGMSPISIFASVDYGHADFKGGWSATVGKIGVKALFNQPTLRSADQTGSSLGKGFDIQLRQAF